MRTRALRMAWALVALLAGLHAQGAARTTVVVDANPSLFVVLSALNVAGYDYGLTQGGASPVRQQVRAALLAKGPLPIYDRLKEYYAGHHLADPRQDLDQYLTLALFLSPPPQMHLTLQVTALPANAGDVEDFVGLLNQFYRDAGVGEIWQSVQPAYSEALENDSRLIRAATEQVDFFLRLNTASANRQVFVYPDAMLSNLQTAPREFEDNFYVAVNLNAAEQIKRIRHTYLFFVLEPVVGKYPAAIDAAAPLLKLVANAPGLDERTRGDADLYFVECLIRAMEIELDGGPAADQIKAVDAAMNQGLLLTDYWYGQLNEFRKDVVSFSEFYPEAAFALREDIVESQNRHRVFTAPADAAPAAAGPERVATPMETAQKRYDAKDFAGAEAIATAELSRPGGNLKAAEYMLGKLEALANHPAEAEAHFKRALELAPASDAFTHTWANIYLARLADARNDRDTAVKDYQLALAAAASDPVLESARQIASDGIKAPYAPGGGH